MSDIVEWLRDKWFAGPMQHFRDWSEIDMRHKEAASEIERLRLAISTARSDGMEEAAMMLNADYLTKEAADFLLERDQQTTQEERCEGEREASAFIILQMAASAIRKAKENGE